MPRNLQLFKRQQCDEGKTLKSRKSCVIKREFSFKDYKKCLMASRFLNIISYLEKNEIDVDCLREYKKEIMKIG